MTCKHLLKGVANCVFCQRDQLRGELSLVEEGLTSYAKEIAQLRNDLTACQLERDQFSKALTIIKDGRIPQAMSPALFAEFVLRGSAQ